MYGGPLLCMSIEYGQAVHCSLLHEEMLLSFKSCTRIHGIPQVAYRTLTTFPPRRARVPGTFEAIKHTSKKKSLTGGESATDTPELSTLKSAQPASSKGKSNTTGLVRRVPKPGALQHAQRSNVPARLLPKAWVSPELTLSPRERLQIEYETRRPPKAKEKPGEHGEHGEHYDGQYLDTDIPQSSKNAC